MALVVAALLRFYRLEMVPPALNQDEAVNGYDAYSLLLTGRDHLGHPFPFAGLESFGDWASPLLTFLTIPAVAIFGLNVEAIRAVGALAGVLAVALIYLLGARLFDSRSVGVVAAWLLAVSPWHVHLSRWAIPTTLVPTMVILTMLLMVWAARSHGSRVVVLAAMSAGLTVASYPTMKLYLPLLGLAALLVYWREYRCIKKEALVYAGLLFLVTAGPILYLSTLDPGGRARLEQVSVLGRPDVDAGFLLRQYASYFSLDFLFLTGDGDPMHTPLGYGVELRTVIPLLLFGAMGLVYLIVTNAGKRRKAALFLLSAVLLAPVPGSLTLPSPHTLRVAHILPLLVLVSSVGAVALVRTLSRLLGDMQPSIVRVVLLLFVMVASAAVALDAGARHRDYFTEYPSQVLRHFQYGLRDAVSYVRARESDYDQIWMTDINQPQIYVLFYTEWPPSDVHESLTVRRAPPRFNRPISLGKYRFGDPPWTSAEDLELAHTVRYPNGQVAYEIRAGQPEGHGRVLVVSRP